MAYTTRNGKVVKVNKGGKLASIANRMSGVSALPKDKGQYNGSCNVKACLDKPAQYWNVSTRAYYCAYCANEINSFCARVNEQQLCFFMESDSAEKPVFFVDSIPSF